MLRILSALTILFCVGSLSALEQQQQWFYSPYSNKLQPLTKLRPLAGKSGSQFVSSRSVSQQQVPLQQQQVPVQQQQQQQQPGSQLFRSVPQQQQVPVQKQQPGLQSLLPRTRAAPVQVTEQGLCAGRQPEEKIPHSTSQNKFIVCHEQGRFDIMDCPTGLFFNLATLNCENTLKAPRGCASNPCQNNGKCVDLPFGQFRCECSAGLGGDFCEKIDSCRPESCGQNGVCIQLAAGSPVDHFCVCNNGLSFGLDCSSRVEPNPCIPNDADLKFFPSNSNAATFVHCEGHIPHLRFCSYPLVFSAVRGDCDWNSF